MHHLKSFNEFKQELQSRTTQFRSKSTIFCPVWPWNLMDDLKKPIGHLFYATSSFVHHFVAMGEFKLELQSGNTQFWANSTFFSCVTLKYDRLPWKTIKQHQSLFIISSSLSFVYSNWRYNPETVKLGFDLCDLDLWSLILPFAGTSS